MHRHTTPTQSDLECMLRDEKVEPKALPLSLLEDITNGFSDEREIGRGGYAVVYKVRQPSTITVLTTVDFEILIDTRLSENIGNA